MARKKISRFDLRPNQPRRRPAPVFAGTARPENTARSSAPPESQLTQHDEAEEAEEAEEAAEAEAEDEDTE